MMNLDREVMIMTRVRQNKLLPSVLSKLFKDQARRTSISKRGCLPHCWGRLLLWLYLSWRKLEVYFYFDIPSSVDVGFFLGTDSHNIDSSSSESASFA